MGKLKICAICHNNNPNLRYMPVPKNPARLKKWRELLNGLEIKTSSKVCEKHFLPEHLMENELMKNWRLSKKAIPTFNLNRLQVTKLIDEKDFDNNRSLEYIKFPKQCFNTIIDNHSNYDGDAKLCAYVTVTTHFMVYKLSCLYCDASYSLRDWDDFSWHISKEHGNDVKTFNELGILRETATIDVEDGDVYDTTVLKENELSVDESLKGKCDDSQNETIEGTDGVENLQIESIFEKEISQDEASSTISSQTDMNNLDTTELEIEDDELNEGISLNQWKWDTTKDMWETVEAHYKVFDMETTAAELVFKLIAALKSYPALWFINFYDTKENKALILHHFKKFSEKFQLNYSQSKVQDCLIKINDWYKRIYEAGNFNQLTSTQSEYYQKLAEFLPDKKNGKTCILCQKTFQDHFQYYGHQRLAHAEIINEIESPLRILKAHASEYIRARYPRYVSFSYRCQICHWEYTQKQNFVEHIKTYLNVREHICDVCGKIFGKIQTYNKHKKRHAGLHRVICQICNKDFDNFSLLTTHRKRYHTAIEGTIEEIAIATSNLRTKFFKFQTSKRYFVRKEGNKCYYNCRICKLSYKYKSGVHNHYRRNHVETHGK